MQTPEPLKSNETNEFLARIIPWPAPSDAGYNNVHWKDPVGHGGVPGYACRTLEEMNARLEWLRKKPWDLYFCMSRQSHHGKVDRRGNPMADRHARDAIALKAIWLDVDVKPEKGYATLAEALDAVATFIGGASLPPPSALVFSGGGVHVYWISDKPLTSAEWLPFAKGLRAEAEHLALKCDYGVTTNPVQILRVPGTYNHKTGTRRPVKLVHLGDSYDFFTTPGLSALASLAPHIMATAARKNAHPAPLDLPGFSGKMAPMFAAKLDPHDSLAAGINTYDDRLLNLDEILVNCPHFRDAAITHGQGYSQGLWMLDVLAATFMDDGRRWAHYFSKGYSTYSDEETDRMYDRKVAERASLGLGWPSCNAFENESCKQCAACAYRGKIKSPLSLATSSAGATVGSTAPQAVGSAPSWNPANLQVSFANIPHRRWLYGTYLIRGEITVLAAPGGAGKTALATGVAVEIATGIELLGEKIYQAHDLSVLFINGEDADTEIHRRIWALYLAYANKLARKSLPRLYVAGSNHPEVERLSFLQTTDRNVSVLDQAGFRLFEFALDSLRPDLVVLDPLVTFCGGGNMNDNAVMAQVIRELKRLASKYNCAVLVVHHTRKGADDGNAEAISGASAIVNLARRAIMPVPMTKEEAEQLRVLPSGRSRYLKLIDAKSNLAPRTADSPWYYLHSISLPNAEPPIYPSGDNVQAVQRLNLSVLQAAPPTTDEQKIRDSILDVVRRGKTINGQSYPYSPSAAGANKERGLLSDAMAAVQAVTAPRVWIREDLSAATKRAVREMKDEGVLVEKNMKELMSDPGRFRKGRGLTINEAPQPGLQGKPSEDAETDATLGDIQQNQRS